MPCSFFPPASPGCCETNAQLPAQSRDASNIKENINSDETYETRSKKREGWSRRTHLLPATSSVPPAPDPRSPGGHQKGSRHPSCANLQGNGAGARAERGEKKHPINRWQRRGRTSRVQALRGKLIKRHHPFAESELLLKPQDHRQPSHLKGSSQVKRFPSH